MIIVLKIIFAIMIFGVSFAGWNTFQDYRATRKQDGYDELSIWRRLKFNLTFFAMSIGLISLIVFLGYFLFVKIIIG